MESKLRLTPSSERKIRSQMHYWVQDDVNFYELVLLKQDSRCNKKADQEKSCIAFKVYSQIKTSYTHCLVYLCSIGIPLLVACPEKTQWTFFQQSAGERGNF